MIISFTSEEDLSRKDPLEICRSIGERIVSILEANGSEDSTSHKLDMSVQRPHKDQVSVVIPFHSTHL